MNAARAFPAPAGFTLWHGFALSLLLHGVPLAPWLLGDSLASPAPREERLVVELFGMVSTRQVEARGLGAEAGQSPAEQAPAEPPPPSAPPPPPPPPPPVEQRKPEEVVKASPAPGPVKVAEPVEARKPVAAPPPPRPTPPPMPQIPPPVVAAKSSAPQVQGADEARRQQALQQANTTADAMHRYLGRLKKAIQSRLVYPREAKQGGQVGVPLVRFRLIGDGSIEAGTLRIQRSSGYPLLDHEALEAARAGAPYDRPPKAMEVVIAVSFAQDQ